MKFDSVDTAYLMTGSFFNRLILFTALTAVCLLSGCTNLPAIKIPMSFATGSKDNSKSPVPSEAIAGFSLAIEAMQKGEDEEALDLFNKLQINYPELSGPWLNTGIILMKQKEYQKALPMFENATSINSENKVGFNQLGVCLRQLGRFEEAKKAYLEALKIDPDYALTHHNLGVLYELYFQDFHSAHTHFLKYQALQKEKDPTVANWLKDLRRRANIPEPAEPVIPMPETKSISAGDTTQKIERKTLW